VTYEQACVEAFWRAHEQRLVEQGRTCSWDRGRIFTVCPIRHRRAMILARLSLEDAFTHAVMRGDPHV